MTTVREAAGERLAPHPVNDPCSGRPPLTQPRVCRMCERPSTVRSLTDHHLVPKHWFADERARCRTPPPASSRGNIVRLCRPCHDLVDHGQWRWRRVYRRMLRLRLHAYEVAFCTRTRGSEWFDAAYPNGVVYPSRPLGV